MSREMDKLKSVEHTINRLIALLPIHNPYLSTLEDLSYDLKRFFEFNNQNQSLAEEFSEPGTLKRYLLTRGFMPHNEKDAEAILDNIIKENESR